jgi:hypothetical protein
MYHLYKLLLLNIFNSHLVYQPRSLICIPVKLSTTPITEISQVWLRLGMIYSPSILPGAFTYHYWILFRTLQLEFKYLSELSGDKKYWNKAEKVLGQPRIPSPVDPRLTCHFTGN